MFVAMNTAFKGFVEQTTTLLRDCNAIVDTDIPENHPIRGPFFKKLSLLEIIDLQNFHIEFISKLLFWRRALWLLILDFKLGLKFNAESSFWSDYYFCNIDFGLIARVLYTASMLQHKSRGRFDSAQELLAESQRILEQTTLKVSNTYPWNRNRRQSVILILNELCLVSFSVLERIFGLE
jgi:hypothetical protein